MKLLYIDLISPAGHENYDMNMIRLMNKYFDVDVRMRRTMLPLIPKDFYKTAQSCPDEIYPETWKGKCSRIRSMWSWRYHQYRYIKNVLEQEASHYDRIFFSSIEVYSFMLATRFCQNKNIYFVDHGVYRIKNKLTNFFYKNVLNSCINNIALEEYIQNYLLDRGVKTNISVIHHPIPAFPTTKWQSLQNKPAYEVFAPSSSNDETFISTLIEKRGKISSNIRMTIRSHHNHCSHNNLIVYNNRISREEYNRRFSEADFILVPYEDTYNYRTSAILFESLGMGKRVLLWGNNTLKNYFDGYPNCVCIFDNIDDLILKLSSIKELKFDDEQIRMFMSRYSDDYIQLQIKNSLNV